MQILLVEIAVLLASRPMPELSKNLSYVDVVCFAIFCKTLAQSLYSIIDLGYWRIYIYYFIVYIDSRGISLSISIPSMN